MVGIRSLLNFAKVTSGIDTGKIDEPVNDRGDELTGKRKARNLSNNFGHY